MKKIKILSQTKRRLFTKIIKEGSTIVLTSGGIESITLCTMLHRNGENIVPLFINYGQKAFLEEKETILKNKEIKKENFQEIDLRNLRDFFHDFQKNKMHIPIPHRNLLILSLSYSLASQIKSSSIVLGSNIEDSYYPSQSEKFLTKFNESVQELEKGITIRRPFEKLTKMEVIKIGKELNIDFGELTFSCIRGINGIHCGSCKQCISRKEAFIASKIIDNTIYFSN
jgi:7-cyano-7-deazaguanine synthase